MRTNIVIDDELMAKAMEASGAKTKREAVEEALRTMIRFHNQQEIRKYRGKLTSWEGDLETMRLD
ncbi:type II toxin-antitoxin system VapB family antitoxin [Sphingomonas sp. LT1P40]|uniref:type II toxin-antitoxin system VapB family antitoxin n=1 Tax=Alteristakelama amylovorans TaxID=3096166 RepID=UPI002FCBD37B